MRNHPSTTLKLHPHTHKHNFIVTNHQMVGYNIKETECEDTKRRIEKEMALSTDLLSEAGIEAPVSCYGKCKTEALIAGYLFIYTIFSALTIFAVNGRLKCIYSLKSLFTLFGLFSIHKKSPLMTFLFTGVFGASIVIEAVPSLMGVVAMFSRDMCTILTGGLDDHRDYRRDEQFLRFCKENVDFIRISGCSMIILSLLVDSYMFAEMVKYSGYLKKVEYEKKLLNRYTGKERIAIP